MKKNNIFKEIAQGLVVTVVGFVLLEALLRMAYSPELFVISWGEAAKDKSARSQS